MKNSILDRKMYFIKAFIIGVILFLLVNAAKSVISIVDGNVGVNVIFNEAVGMSAIILLIVSFVLFFKSLDLNLNFNDKIDILNKLSRLLLISMIFIFMRDSVFLDSTGIGLERFSLRVDFFIVLSWYFLIKWFGIFISQGSEESSIK